MAEIDVRTASEADGWAFDVTVSEGASHTTHRVTLSSSDYERLTREVCTPDYLIRRSFEFLLERESKESILREFDITVITRYFPEYEGEIAKRVRS